MRAAPWAALISWVSLSFCLLLPSSARAQNPLSGFNPATLAGETRGVFLEARAFCAENTLTLQPLLIGDQKKRPFRPGSSNTADGAWKTASGLIWHGWKFAALYRGEIYLKANRDTLEILRLIDQKKNLPVGREYKIDIQARGFSAFGVEVSKGMKFNILVPGLTAGFTARYLQGEMIQEGKIEGRIIPVSKKSYNFDLSIDYVYDDNLVYDRLETIPGTGTGYSFDFGLQYVMNTWFRGEILCRDIGGRMFWKDVPYTDANASSKNREYDSQGYQIYRPTIRGYESYKDYVQKIPLKTDILISCQAGPFALTPSVSFIDSRPFPWIDLSYRRVSHRRGKNFSLHTGYNPDYRAYSLGVAYGKVSLTISGSDTDINTTQFLGLMLSLQYPW
ncbi:MAG: hypothetical protein AB1611_08325 [bacterium]